ncbi:AAA family ATPase [Fibrella forsythiae]|uniref:AAA family ATPase n=1 Tax=Fibrella forsythiae TaxID=2817061 RepID=A0ABS3JBX4_9BACT|nr:AAA family ATPase [Fibrella forsythiae]MBO0947500.1 AAA family ATPase [Fibrella forsythiae]
MATTNPLELENLFIRLYNQGIPYEKILADLPGVDPEIVARWKANLENAIKRAQEDDFVTAVAEYLDEDGMYVFKKTIKVNMNSAESLRFELARIATREIDLEESKAAPFFEKVRKKAAELYEFVDENVNNFEFRLDKSEEVGPLETQVEFTYNTGIKDEIFHEKLVETLEFFVKYIYMPRNYINKYKIIKDTSVDTYKDLVNSMPFCIKQIKVNDYLCIKSAHIENIPIDTQWIFITGENGYGKSSLLQAIAIGLFGTRDKSINLLKDNSPKIGIEYKKKSINYINNINSGGFESLKEMIGYGPSRLQLQNDMSQNELSEKSSVTYSLFNIDGVLLNIEPDLIRWHIENNPKFEQTTSILKKLIPSLSEIIVQKNKEDQYDVLYLEKEENTEKLYDAIHFSKLASGLKSVIAMVGDIILRFSRLQPNVINFEEFGGIVLIDELENHLHPKWQYELPRLLSTAFPNVQFIATTHSVIPILGAPESSVFLKVTRSKDDGVNVQKIDIDVANLLPNSILTSPLFDMSNILPVSNKNVGDLRTEETYSDVIDAKSIDERLDAINKDSRDYPEYIFD